MKMSTRIFSLALTALLATTMLAGCSGGDAPAANAAPGAANTAADSGAADGVKQVHLYSWSSEDAGATVVEGFNEKYAGQYEMVYNKIVDSKTESINTVLASGMQVDVIMQAAVFDQNFRAKEGNYMGLKQFLDQDGIDYTEFWGASLEKVANFHGDYYGLPYNKNVFVTFFNKKLFDQAGLEYPAFDWTWDDFRDTAMKLTSGEGANKVYGAMFDFAGEDFAWDYIARQKLGAIYAYNEDYTATTYDKPEMKESLQFFYDMVTVDGSLMPLDEYKALRLDDDPSGMAALCQDRFALWLAPVYSAGYMKPSYGELPEGTDIGMATLPAPAGMDPTTLVFGSTASIPSNVADPQAAWAALRYVTIDAPERWAGAKNMHPGFAFADATALHDFNELILGADSGIPLGVPGFDSEMAIALLDQPINEVSKDEPILQGNSKLKDIKTAELTLLFNGEQTVDETLANLKSKGDAAISEDIAAGMVS